MSEIKEGVSVVICTYNGKQRLPDTLHSIICQSIQSSLVELIIVDNASQDGTGEFCAKYLSESGIPFSWKVVIENRPGLNHARLKGFRDAHYDIVLFCDDDNSLDQNYVQIGFNVLKNNPAIGALGGCGIPSFETTKPEWFDRYSHSFAVGPQSSQDGQLQKYPVVLYGAGTFFRKSPLLKFFDKGFNHIMSDRKGNTLASGGDVEWCYLIQLNDYEIWYDHRLTFVHTMPAGRLSWSYYLRLKQAIASGACRLLPYECLLKNHYMSVLGFIGYWSSRTVLSTLVYFKHRLINAVIDKKMDAETELAFIVLEAKMISYWQEVSAAFKHFHHLKSML